METGQEEEEKGGKTLISSAWVCKGKSGALQCSFGRHFSLFSSVTLKKKSGSSLKSHPLD